MGKEPPPLKTREEMMEIFANDTDLLYDIIGKILETKPFDIEKTKQYRRTWKNKKSKKIAEEAVLV